MNSNIVKAKDLGITDEFIFSCIPKEEKVEWKSRKNCLDYIFKDAERNKDWKIIGWVHYKTLNKWGITTRAKCGYMKGVEEPSYWVLCKGVNYWYIMSFLL